MTDLLYNVIHEIGKNNIQIKLDDELISLFYFENNAFSEYASSSGFILKNIYDNVDLDIVLGALAFNQIFYIKDKVDKITIKLILPSDIVVEKNGNIFAFNQGDKTLFDMTESPVIDSLGQIHKTAKINISKGIEFYNVVISFDNSWIKNDDVYPLEYHLPLSFSHASAVSLQQIISASTTSDQIYSDVREESACQFYVVFYDDSEFRRPRAIYSGLPVCSTVPYAVGDVYDLSEDDIEQWYQGLGDAYRNVYLQIIASKPLTSYQTVQYDVYLPGAIDYTGQVAEFVDTIDGLPIYRGMFTVYKNNTPSYIDGLGYLDVYLREGKESILSTKLDVLGYNYTALDASLSLYLDSPTYDDIGMIAASIIVDAEDGSAPYYDISALDAEIIVDAEDGSSPYYDLSLLTASIDVTRHKNYGLNKIDATIDVDGLGRDSFPATITITTPSDEIGYSLSMLEAKINVVMSPNTSDPWYDANNWNYYGPAEEKTQVLHSDDDIFASFTFTQVTQARIQGSALDSDGYVWSWGIARYSGVNYSGDLDDHIIPTQLDTTYVFDDIRVNENDYFTIGLNSSGEIWAWGVNANGIFGATSTSSQTPVDISDSKTFTKIDTGYNWAAAVDSAGKVYYKGDVLRLGTDVTTWTICADIAALTFTDVCCSAYCLLALNAAGEVYKVGQFVSEGASAGVKISGAHVFTKIVAFADHAIGIKADGTAWGWGRNSYDQMGATFTDNYTTSPVQITEVTSVDDMATGITYSTFLCGSNVYVLGSNLYDGNPAYPGYLTSVDTTRETRTIADLVEPIRPLNSWSAVFCGSYNTGAIHTSGKVYSNFSNDLMEYQFSGYLQDLKFTNTPTKLNIVGHQDLWGGNSVRFFSNGSDSIYLPTLNSYFTRSIRGATGYTDGPSRFAMDATELSSADINEIVARMNEPYGIITTNWMLYQTYMGVDFFKNLFSEDYTNFPYLYMKMEADSTLYSPFKQRSYYPYDKVAYGYENYPFAQDTTNMFYVKVSYILNNLSSPLTPFDDTYSLKTIGWSENYSVEDTKMGVYVDLYDEQVGYCVGTTKLKTLSASSNEAVFTFGISDFLPTPISADGIHSIKNTYPTKVRILIQPKMYIYTYNTYQNIFVSPQNWIEVTDIVINPYAIDSP